MSGTPGNGALSRIWALPARIADLLLYAAGQSAKEQLLKRMEAFRK